MVGLIKIILFVSIFTASYNILAKQFGVYAYALDRNISIFKRIAVPMSQRDVQQQFDEFCDRVGVAFTRVLNRIPSFQFKKLKVQLYRVYGNTKTVESFYAECFKKAFMVLIGGIILSFVNFALFLFSIILAALVFYSPFSRLYQDLKLVDAEFVKEFVNFVTVFKFQSKEELSVVIKKYISKSGDSILKRDFEKLLLDMDPMGVNNALLTFAENVNLPNITAFVNFYIIARQQGMDMQVFLTNQEKEMRKIVEEERRRELSKKPDQLFMLAFGIFGAILLTFLVALGAGIFTQMGNIM